MQNSKAGRIVGRFLGGHLPRAAALACVCSVGMLAQTQNNAKPTGNAGCQVEEANYQGWHAQQVSSRWVQLVVLPQNGGRLIQVTFNGHPYLFVNPKLAGKYMPPSENQWFNYGGDKLWLLPEGEHDEQHWRGNSDTLDDTAFTFRVLPDGSSCTIELTGPADVRTGIQFSRTIHLDPDSPQITFRASMKNISGHSVDWSMQSVSQYNTGNPADPSHPNRDIWGYTPVNASSSYLDRYHVRFGPSENPRATVREDGLFAVHYAPLAAELWIDSTAGWLAVIDGSSQYGMVERFQHEETKSYPGKASVIFWTNGRGMRLNSDGVPTIDNGSEDASPFYMEAELNSPMCHLRAGESCQFETEWFPTRAQSEFHGATEAALIAQPLRASAQGGNVRITGSFGVFFPGKLVARFYDERGAFIGTAPVADVNPSELVKLDMQAKPQGDAKRMSLHLEDQNGLDRGAIGEIPISSGNSAE